MSMKILYFAISLLMMPGTYGQVTGKKPVPAEKGMAAYLLVYFSDNT